MVLPVRCVHRASAETVTSMRRCRRPTWPLLAGLLAAIAPGAHAADRPLRDSGIVGANVKAHAQAALGILGYATLPDGTVSSLDIDQGSTGNPQLTMFQLGAGFTVAKSFPPYLEGFLGASRYDPTFVFSDGTAERRLPTRWNSLAATGGIGWDFPIAEHLVLRPIVDLALGYVASDARLGQALINYRGDRDLDFLKNGDMTTAGIGGALMLDYELARPTYEFDAELRVSQFHMRTIGGSAAVQGEASYGAVNLWTRLRVPTGFELLDRPLRLVTEVAHSEFFGDQVTALGFDHMTSLGLGLELDLSAVNDAVTRARMVGRYAFGEDIDGFAIGLAISF